MAGAKKRSGLGWTDLPDEIWILIIGKLPLEDVIRCRSICTSLSSIIQDVKPCSTENRIPWVMVPDRGHNDRWKFFDVATDKVHTILLPELRQSVILGSFNGWLILVDGGTADLRLFSLFNRARIPLPPTTSLPNFFGANHIVEDKWLSSKMEPLKVTCAVLGHFHSSYAVVVTYGTRLDPFLAFARPGDGAWIALEAPGMSGDLSCTFFQNIIYVMDERGQLVSFDFSGSKGASDLACQPVARFGPEHVNCWFEDTTYLVALPESDALLHIRYGRSGVKVFKLDCEAGEWVEVSSLGGHSLFLAFPGMSRKIAVSLQLPRQDLKANCIYVAGLSTVFDLDSQNATLTPSIRSRWDMYPNYHKGPYWISPVLTDIDISRPGT